MITKRHQYKGYIIDRDDIGRLYLYNTKSPVSEDCDKVYIKDTVYSNTDPSQVKLSELKTALDAYIKAKSNLPLKDFISSFY